MWLIFPVIVFGLFPLFSNGDQSSSGLKLKQFLEPCDTIYSQVHCDDEDDEEYESSLHECAPIKTDDCDRGAQLYCHTGVCLPNCHPTKEVYDPMDGKCFKKAGQDCSHSEECDKNAICERRQCQCARNFTEEPETEKCVRSAEFGEHCDSDISCNVKADMVCNNNVCECRSPETQFYHSKRKRCYIRVGQDCSNKARRSFQLCLDNADCVQRITSNHSTNEEEEEMKTNIGPVHEKEGEMYKCTCKEGHAPTNDGKSCLGLYKTKCNSLHRCNTERSLKCFNNTNNNMCQCARPKDQVYHPQHQRCVTLIGSLCKEGEDTCLDWADCKPDADKQISTCECVDGFSSAFENEVCLKYHGNNCSSKDEPHCNSFLGLECSNYTGTCQCLDSEQFFDVKLKTCRNFQVVPRPATHYDTSDREYMFHYNKNISSSASLSKFTLFICLALLACYKNQ